MDNKITKHPLKGITVQDAAVGVRTPNVIMGEYAGEYVKGDMMDANATMAAVKTALGGVPEAFFQKDETLSIDRIKEILYEIVNAQQETAASISEDGDASEQAPAQLNMALDPIGKKIVEKFQEIINSPQAISSDEDDNIDEQIDEYAKQFYQMFNQYYAGLGVYSHKFTVSGDNFAGAYMFATGVGYEEALIYQSLSRPDLAPQVFYVSSFIEDGDPHGQFCLSDPYYGTAITNMSSYEGLQLIGVPHSGDSDSGILLSGSRNEDTAVLRISDRSIYFVNGMIEGKLCQTSSTGYNRNVFLPTEFKVSNSNEYAFIGNDKYDHPCIQMCDGSETKFDISNTGIITKRGQCNNYVFASGRMLSVGDINQYTGSLIFPAIAPLVTSEYESKITKATEYYVPNCYLKNVKNLSSTAEITYNDKTYTLNMDKAIELGLFVESTAAAATSEEGTETA